MELKDLKQDKRNYRKHNKRNLELIKKSVDEVGLGRSVVIDSENEIICGNGLVSTLDKNTKVKVIETDGSELVVVKRTDLKTEDAKRKQLAVMDNSTSDSSEFDIDLLEEDFSVETLNDWGLDVDLKLDDKEIIEDEVPEQVETRCKSGDIWQLGEHRLMCGDSTKVQDVDKLMNGEVADLLLTDPPYNVNYEGKTKDKLKIKNDLMDDLNFQGFLKDAFSCADKFMKPVGLFDYQIKNNTKGSDIVLDLFAGSGTTIIACEQDGRKARCMELDSHYCDVVIQRWENLTGKKAELING